MLFAISVVVLVALALVGAVVLVTQLDKRHARRLATQNRSAAARLAWQRRKAAKAGQQ